MGQQFHFVTSHEHDLQDESSKIRQLLKPYEGISYTEAVANGSWTWMKGLFGWSQGDWGIVQKKPNTNQIQSCRNHMTARRVPPLCGGYGVLLGFV